MIYDGLMIKTGYIHWAVIKFLVTCSLVLHSSSKLVTL